MPACAQRWPVQASVSGWCTGKARSALHKPFLLSIAELPTLIQQALEAIFPTNQKNTQIGP